MKSIVRTLIALAAASLLVSCNAFDSGGDESRPFFGRALSETGLFKDLSARRPVERGDSATGFSPGSTPGRTLNLSQGSAGDPLAAVSAGSALTAGDGDYRLNFDKADLREVVRVVLNDTLGLNYSMSPDVAGTVTMSSARPLNRTELLSALEATLSGQGFAMTRTATGYRIGPSATDAGAVDRAGATQPGYGVSVVPLRHVSVATMMRLVSGFVAEADGLRVDPSSNAILVRGPGARREEAIRTIEAFDADWMRGQAVSVFEVRRARPETVIAELTQIFDVGENGSGAGVIQFKPITRMKAILAVSKNPALIRRAEAYVRRLDGETIAGADSVFVYRARYRDAKELARVVGTIFSARGDARGAPRGPADGRQGTSSASAEPDQRDSFSLAQSGRQAAGSATRGASPTFVAAFGDQVGGSPGSAAPSAATAPDPIDLTREVQAAAPRVTIAADTANNSVVTHADGETYRKILTTLRQLDAAPLQVAINVLIAEVKLNDQLRFGIQYFINSDRVRGDTNKGSVSLVNQVANVLQRQVPGFNFVVGNSAAPDVIISALDEITNVQVLSSPSLVVLENQSASLQVGDEIPITTRQAQSVENVNAPLINQVEFRDTGIILRVTPRIGQNDAVTMQIEQEISSVVGASGTLTPTISKRKVASTISVVSGQTVLLAGLISEKFDKSKGGLPVLSRIPTIGDLFGNKVESAERTELVVFIRPVVIRDGQDAQSVAEEFRSRLQISERRRPAPRSPAPILINKP